MKTQGVYCISGISYQLLSDRGLCRGGTTNFGFSSQLSISLGFSGLLICRSNNIFTCNLDLVNFKGQFMDGRRTKQPSISVVGKECLLSRSSANSRPSGVAYDDDLDVDDVDDDDELRHYRGLVLDVAYRPINVVGWRRALCLDILEKADVLEYYEQVVCSPSRAFFIPAVLKVASFVHSPKPQQVTLSLNRNNILMRDKFKCQYCSARDDLTIDHVFAVSRGGGRTWENLVTACLKCNLKKGNKTLEEAHMKLIRVPMEPKAVDVVNLPPKFKSIRSLRRHATTPPQWLHYLPSGLGLHDSHRTPA